MMSLTASDHTEPCFVLRVSSYKDEPLIVIKAYDDMIPQWDSAGRIRLTCEVRQGGKVIFPKGQLYCALHGTSDGIAARELIMSLVAMAPHAGGGEGLDYYRDYSLEQAEWANAHYELLDIEREVRYCDENGNPRRAH